ncbi:MAG: protein-L-isoaspartate(D-aspartate) O-methyltransferase [Spirochaetota bacterium]
MTDDKKRDRLTKVIRSAGIENERLYRAVAEIDRADFLPAGLPAGVMYHDAPIQIGEGQTTSQPSLVAQMIDALELSTEDSALEIGTGYGYQTALLASICARVVSIEQSPELAQHARTNLAVQGFENVEVITGDGTHGAPAEAPFDGIVVSAAAPEVPSPLAEQLAEQGRMVIPLGPGGREEVLVYGKRSGRLEMLERMTLAAFVPLLRR